MTAPTLKPDMTRVHLAGKFAEYGYKSGAEIGTWRGAYAYTLCRANPLATIYCIDPWVDADDNFLKTCHRLSQFSNYKIIRDFSEHALHTFEDGSLDFVYIDANHELPHVMDDIVNWSDKVRSGGIVSGHDYGENKDVTKAVDQYTAAHLIDRWYVIGTPARAQSYYWVKP